MKYCHRHYHWGRQIIYSTSSLDGISSSLISFMKIYSVMFHRENIESHTCQLEAPLSIFNNYGYIFFIDGPPFSDFVSF